MNRHTASLGVAIVLASLAGLVACDGGGGQAGTASTSAPTTKDSAKTTTSASASAKPAASEVPSAEPSATASATASASASASGSADAAPNPAPGSSAAASGSASASDKSKWSCGNKGQKACPMQGWMRGVMGRAMQKNDKDKIAQALTTIAAKVPAGDYGQWSGIAAAGASKAAAGDIEGAKASCKKCHALYQKRYISKQRDQPW